MWFWNELYHPEFRGYVVKHQATLSNLRRV